MFVRKIGFFTLFFASGFAFAQEPVEEFITDSEASFEQVEAQNFVHQNQPAATLPVENSVVVNSASLPELEHARLQEDLRSISVDTFGKALRAQGQVAASEMQAKIRQNLGVNTPGAAIGAGVLPENAMPLLNAKQSFNSDEPTLEAIWGMEGREVAEVNYKGVRYSVSMQSPRVSEDADWYLKKIMPFHIVLEQRKGKKVIKTKDIPLNWNSNVGAVFKVNHLTGEDSAENKK